MAGPLYIAVDLGAGSGRVFLCGVDPDEMMLDEVHRFQYLPEKEDGHLRWNFELIFEEILTGLAVAATRSKKRGRAIRSIGIDSWAVDYGLLDDDGELIANPICYRDGRTKSAMESVFAVVPRSKIFEKTGIQFQPFNTLFQLHSESDIGKAKRLLLLPDLINYFLTGKAFAEYTNATTTQMVNAASGDWDLDLLQRLNIPQRIMPEIVSTGTEIGYLRPELADDLGLQEVRVIAPATHDTGSAIAGAPLRDGQGYISSGTWSLIGIETDRPVINAEAERLNFTNEGGVYGTFRFLKNVMGLWIFESCRREWKAVGTDVEYDTLLAEVSAKKEFKAFIFPDDPRFLNPASMLDAIADQLAETGQKFENSPAELSKIIFDSLAFRYASVVRSIEAVTEKSILSIQILGGGGRNGYLNQMTANATGLSVQAGLTEATVVGNVLVQAITAGRFSNISDARDHVRNNFELGSFEPQMLSKVAVRRYAEIEARYGGS